MLRWIEGFESFGTTPGNNPVGFAAKWNCSLGDSSYTVRAGRINGQSLRLPTNLIPVFGPTLGTPQTVVVGFGFYQDAFASAQQIVQFRDGPAYQGSVVIQTDGTWKYHRGDSQIGGPSLGQSSGHGASASAWIYVEIKVKFHGSTGTVEIHVDGNSVLSLTGQNTSQTGNAFCTNIAFQGSSGGSDHTQLDDIYMLDTTGSYNNDFLGPVNIKVLWATSDGGTNQFTPSSGANHYDRVNENPQDTTTYLEDGTAGDKELFGVTNLNLATIAGIQMNTVAKLTD